MPARARSATKAASKAAKKATKPAATRRAVTIPDGVDDLELTVGGHALHLTHLGKPFWPALGITKGDLLRYYAAMAPVLVPHLKDRAMVMKRYPNGARGKCFFMKRAPSPRPDWIETCAIEHASKSVIDFPMAQDAASILWLVNLGCIDLNQWYSRCDDIDRPDYLHFDLDPAAGASFERVLEVALIVRDALAKLGMHTYVKTSGATGVHVYVPIVRGPLQKEVWTFAKAFAQTIARDHPRIATSEYIIAKRPRGRVFVDYNQNAWGKTLASVYSVRPTKSATVSTPLEWSEVERGVRPEDFTMDVVLDRVRERGDLWKGLLAARGRVKMEAYL